MGDSEKKKQKLFWKKKLTNLYTILDRSCYCILLTKYYSIKQNKLTVTQRHTINPRDLTGPLVQLEGQINPF